MRSKVFPVLVSRSVAMVQVAALLTATLPAALLLGGCGGGGGGEPNGGASTVPTSTATPMSTMALPAECGEVVDGKRARAKPNNATASTQDECCGACHVEEQCIAWMWLDMQQRCTWVASDATWTGVADAEHYVMGVKKNLEVCSGCDDCGRTMDRVDDHCRDCTICSNGDNWNIYPCFLENACACGGDDSAPGNCPTTQTTTPSAGPFID